MRKGLIVLLVAVVAVAFALPAAADMTPTNLKVSGFYRSKAYLSNFIDGYSKPSIRTGQAGDEEQTNAFVEQRFRVKFDFGSENVKAVWYLESDNIWGDAGGSAKITTADTTGLGAQRNTGGALGADRINTETKNIYVWFKVPDTSIDFTVGLQNQSDDYAGVIYGGADMAGIFMTGKFEPVKYKFGWAKLYENAVQKTDDQTLYYGSVDLVPTKDAQLGINFYFLQDDTAKVTSAVEQPSNPGANTFKSRVYMPGVNGAVKVGPATISGFFMYQFGKIDPVNQPTVSSIDIQAFMVDLRGDMKVGPGNAFIEGIYLSGSSDPQNKYKAPITLATREASPGGNSSFTRLESYQMLASPDTINVSQCLVGCSGAEVSSDPGANGRGITAGAVGYKQKVTQRITGSGSFVYLAATDRLTTDTGTSDTMGYELNARVDYNIYKGLDVGGVGSYMWIGDFFKDSAGDVPKNPWTVYARINYAF
jgi:hypothetical protein